MKTTAALLAAVTMAAILALAAGCPAHPDPDPKCPAGGKCGPCPTPGNCPDCKEYNPRLDIKLDLETVELKGSA